MQAFVRAWEKACSSTSKKTTILVPAGKKYNLKPITFEGPCKSDITFKVYMITNNINSSTVCFFFFSMFCIFF